MAIVFAVMVALVCSVLVFYMGSQIERLPSSQHQAKEANLKA